ncbi:putative polyketide synthase PksJ [Myriangium duriaei CBS 260.36]|uniref:Polyketide synthase PksJ n=1 Tax=Myriangium duriaei CBS 260.36 TaxID=1168546 RepID=A0A9P4IUR0_9PEZI|nr:putative polyketide synthase PksJ [Myriangium duriaei CBS 260.36]
MLTPESSPRLESLLDRCANSEAGITLYKGIQSPPEHLTYRELRDIAAANARRLHQQHGVVPGQIMLVHFQTHRDNIIWFWTSILAGCHPAMSTPFVKQQEGRLSHLTHLHQLLLNPIVLTTQELKERDFADQNAFRILAIDKDINDLPFTKVTEDTTQLSDGDDDDESPEFYWDDDSESLSSQSDDSHWDRSSDSSANGRRNSSWFDDTEYLSSGQSSPPTHGAFVDTAKTHDVPFPNTPITPIDDDELCPTSLRNVAALMLTSGSTGNAKAVCLTHQQILAACKAKLTALPASRDSTLLNWIGLDHVGSLTELHITGMLAMCHQVHVPAADIISDPLAYLRLLTEHKVVGTFAPNFFIHSLIQRLDAASAQDLKGIDLSNLVHLVSGGEPNPTDTCIRISEHLSKFGAHTNVLRPGFGMSETCAGCIYNKNCPAIDIDAETEFAALGKCASEDIEMRVTRTGDSDEGSLELRGPIVFRRYFNNPKATQEAFTPDGWFITGDTATIDATGVLRLVGRSKDLINVNGVKFLPHELETAIEREMIPGVARSFVLCFAYRPVGAQTESVYVVYQRSYSEDDYESRMSALQAISWNVVMFTGARPHVLPLSPGRLERTSLGKLSRAKARTSLLRGEYGADQEVDARMLETFRATRSSEPANATEQKLLDVFVALELGAPDMGTEMSVLDTGVSSVDLIRLKRAMEKSFSIPDIPIITLMSNTTIKSLAVAISSLQQSHYHESYSPIVTLQPGSPTTDKVPIYLLHPGIGECLCFLNLVQHFPDRPMYAMRARGLNPGETPFTSLSEVIDTYYTAIKSQQPRGPYALAGYSYGSMLAVELAKRLEADEPDCVKFLGSFNLPPHIKQRMRRLDWTAGLTHIANFCSIVSEERSEVLRTELRDLGHAEQVATLLAEADEERCAQLALTQESLHNWVDVSFSLQTMGWEYDPSGLVERLDVFYCQPLKDVAGTRKEYREEHLEKWRGFVKGEVRFHEVAGRHYTMIDREHAPEFARRLRRALEERGL